MANGLVEAVILESMNTTVSDDSVVDLFAQAHVSKIYLILASSPGSSPLKVIIINNFGEEPGDEAI